MKKMSLFFSALAVVFMISCEGPAGPPGPPGFDGFDGQDGINILGTVFEIEGSFNQANDYALLYEFPTTVEVFESDVVLVYILWDQAEDGNGDPVDIWRLLPQTRLLDQGILQYNFDHTFFDVSVFLESDFDLATLQTGDTDNQVFRIAVLPAAYGTTGKLDTSNIDAVMRALNVSENEVQRVILN
ncbi:collagen-like protein [Muriicola sp.]|uniref:collagen-like protein n=1 Tax=Muriicola sp. TaxID=2020856 RepID=UPI003C73C367